MIRHRQRVCMVLSLLMVGWISARGGSLGADRVDPDAGWGEPVQGLRCRLLVPSAVCQGQPILAAVEIQNTSANERCVLKCADFRDSNLAQLAITGPDNVPLAVVSGCRYGLERDREPFVPLAPGATKRFELQDLRGAVRVGPDRRSPLVQPGTYTLAYSFLGARRTDDGDASAGKPNGKTWAGHGCTSLAAAPAQVTVREPTAADLTVHEWGVFTVYENAAYANADMKAEWESFPDWFYRQFPTLRLRTMPTCVRKPIVYFHSPHRAQEVKFEVTFAQGAPVVWWPAATEPARWTGPGSEQLQKPLESPFRTLVWACQLNTGVEIHPLPTNASPACAWLADARAVPEAAVVRVPEESFRREIARGEHFLYYDGLIPAMRALACVRATADAVTLKNAAAFPLQHVFVVDRRLPAGGGEAPGWAQLAALEPGEEKTVTFGRVPAGAWPAPARAALQDALAGTGLLASEAESLVKIWQEGLFQAKGITAFYLLPQAEYDRMLPAKVDPKPGAFLRVGLILHPHLEGQAAVAREVSALVARLGGAEEKDREQARLELMAYGPAAQPVLQKALAASKDPGLQEGIRAILKAGDAASYLPADMHTQDTF